MTTRPTYDPARTGLLFVDPYNDFLSEGGKLWPMVKKVAEQVRLIDNLKAVVKTVREKSHPGVHRTPSSLGARGL
jgi:nicotinamidase-related amidase